MATRVPTHVPTLGVQYVHCKRTSLYVPCMQLILQNSSALGLRRYRECFTCTRPNVLMEEAQAHNRKSPSPNTSSSFISSPTNRRSGPTKHHWMSFSVITFEYF